MKFQKGDKSAISKCYLHVLVFHNNTSQIQCLRIIIYLYRFLNAWPSPQLFALHCSLINYCAK